MKNFLDFLNGYKTIIGLVLLCLMGAICMTTGIDIPNFDEPGSWPEVTKWIGLLLAAIFTQFGLFDKIAKTRAAEMLERLSQSFPSVLTIKNEVEQLKQRYYEFERLNRNSGAGGVTGTAQSGQITGTER